MLTYQDFEKARASGGVPAFIGKLLGEHAGSSMVQTANFNPRTPCGVRRVAVLCFPLLALFQSTHPVRGATWR